MLSHIVQNSLLLPLHESLAVVMATVAESALTAAKDYWLELWLKKSRSLNLKKLMLTQN